MSSFYSILNNSKHIQNEEQNQTKFFRNLKYKFSSKYDSLIRNIADSCEIKSNPQSDFIKYNLFKPKQNTHIHSNNNTTSFNHPTPKNLMKSKLSRAKYNLLTGNNIDNINFISCDKEDSYFKKHSNYQQENSHKHLERNQNFLSLRNLVSRKNYDNGNHNLFRMNGRNFEIKKNKPFLSEINTDTKSTAFTSLNTVSTYSRRAKLINTTSRRNKFLQKITDTFPEYTSANAKALSYIRKNNQIEDGKKLQRNIKLDNFRKTIDKIL